MKHLQVFLKNIRNIQTYILGVSLFFEIIIVLPFLSDQYVLPKLTVLRIAGFFVLFLEAIQIIFSKKHYKLFKSDIVLIIFLFLQIIGFIFSVNKSVSFWGIYTQEGLDLFSVLIYFFIVWVYCRLPKANQGYIKWFLVAATALSSFQAIFRYLTVGTRPNGLEGQPILTSSIIVIGFFIMLENFSTVNIKYKKIIIGGLSLVYFYGLYVLDSTIGWAMIIGSLGFYFLTYIIKSSKFTFFKKGLLLGGFVIILLVIIPRLLSKEAFTLSQRFKEIKAVAAMISKETFKSDQVVRYMLIGHGQYSSGFFFQRYRQPEPNHSPESEWRLSKIRNQFVEIFYTLGIFNLGLLLYLSYRALNNTYISRPHSFIIISSIIIFELLYFLTPLLYLISLIYIIQSLKVKTIKLPKILPIGIYVIGLSLIITAIFGVYISIRLFTAEYWYSKNNLQKAVQMSPFNPDYKVVYAQQILDEIKKCKDQSLYSCDEEGLFLKSTELTRESILLNPYDPDNWDMHAATLFRHSLDFPAKKLKLQKDALIDFKQATSLDPLNPSYWDSVGLIYLDQKLYFKAEEYFYHALKLQNQFIGSYRHLKELYKQTGDEVKY